MAEWVWVVGISIVCTTIVVIVFMIKSSISHLSKAEKENFTFAVKFFGGSGMYLWRGNHKPPSNLHESKSSAVKTTQKRELEDSER